MGPHGLSSKSDVAWIKRSASGMELARKTIKGGLKGPQVVTYCSTEVLRLSSSLTHIPDVFSDDSVITRPSQGNPGQVPDVS